MKNSFGPWGTALEFGPNPRLSAFWKRRMAMLVSASRSSRRLSWPAAVCLIVASILTCLLPTLRKASALSEETEQTVVSAGDRDERRPETPLHGFPVALEVADSHQQAPGLTSTGQGDAPAVDAEEALEEFLKRAETPRPPRKGRLRLHVRDSDGQITALRLKGIELKKGDLSVIGRLHRLETLDLSATNVTDEDLRDLGGLANLHELQLWDTGIDGSGLAYLGELDRLETLNLGDAKVTDDALRYLGALDGLRRLTLTRNGIGDSGLAHLGRLRRLVALKLGETNITDEGLHHLAGLTDLRSLTLDQTKISQSGLEYLAELPSLQWIASPVRTAEELVRRMEQGEYQAADDMLTVGLDLPRRGEFQLQKLEALPRTERDRQRARQRFRLEMHWKAQYDPMPESPGTTFPELDGTFFSVFAVNRGAIRAIENGIVED